MFNFNDNSFFLIYFFHMVKFVLTNKGIKQGVGVKRLMPIHNGGSFYVLQPDREFKKISGSKYISAFINKCILFGNIYTTTMLCSPVC